MNFELKRLFQISPWKTLFFSQQNWRCSPSQKSSFSTYLCFFCPTEILSAHKSFNQYKFTSLPWQLFGQTWPAGRILGKPPSVCVKALKRVCSVSTVDKDGTRCLWAHITSGTVYIKAQERVQSLLRVSVTVCKLGPSPLLVAENKTCFFQNLWSNTHGFDSPYSSLENCAFINKWNV